MRLTSEFGYIVSTHVVYICKLIYSPDTDVYHIGLTVLSEIPEREVIVQLSKRTDRKARYIHINSLIEALHTDPDLCQVSPELRPQLLQSLYIATGSDYTSFFNGIEKVSFLTTFFQCASFISGSNGPPGNMGDINDEGCAKFSFLRLVGCAYYKQHKSGFRTQTAEVLYHSINATPTYDQHTQWLAQIRSVVRQRADSESKSMPSTESLLLHWKRCTWVLKMWNCATHTSITLPGTVCMCRVYTHILTFTHFVL